MAKLTFEDFSVGQITEFGNHTVTKEEIIEFASKYDPHSFHLDEEEAKNSIFGALCSSGWMTCAISMRMLYDNILVKSASLGSPGIDELRWLHPVFVDDQLSLVTEVLETTPSKSRPEMGVIKTLIKVKNQNGKTVLRYISIGMFLKKNP